MQNTCKISETFNVRSETKGMISVVIGTDARLVPADLVRLGAQNGKNVGLKLNPLISNVTTIKEADPKRFLVITNSEEKINDVVVSFDDGKSETVSADTLIKAVQICKI